jgi:hypothetical protein
MVTDLNGINNKSKVARIAHLQKKFNDKRPSNEFNFVSTMGACVGAAVACFG